MDIVRKIINCQTVDELVTLENLYVLSDYEQGLVFERKTEITSHLAEWGIENVRQGLSADVMNSWTPEQRERCLLDWNDDEPFRQMSDEEFFGQAFHGKPIVQAGRGQRKSHDEMNVRADDENVSGHVVKRMDHICKTCSKKFTRLRNLRRHERSVHRDMTFVCGQCSESFTRKDTLKRHQKRHQGIVTHACTNCGKAFYRRDKLVEHQAQCQGNPLKTKCYENDNSLAQKKEQAQVE